MDGGFGFGDEINGWYIFLGKYGIIRIIMSRTRRIVDRQRSGNMPFYLGVLTPGLFTY
jgi:hypothetical protein